MTIRIASNLGLPIGVLTISDLLTYRNEQAMIGVDIWPRLTLCLVDKYELNHLKRT
jgi:hypothetical protein